MRYRSSYGRIIAPLIVGGLAVIVLLPGGEPPATTVPAPVQAAALAPAPTAIAVARVGNALLSPIPMTDLAPSTAVAAVPNASVAPLAPSVETTASIPDTPAAAPPVAGQSTSVGGRPVNMRVGPSKDTATVTVLQPGEPLQVIEQTEGWTYVATLKGDTGWVSSRFIGDDAAAAIGNDAAAPAPDKDRSTTNGTTMRARGAITVRSGPSTDADRLFVIDPGERLRIAETRDGWARVVLKSGISGWIRLRR